MNYGWLLRILLSILARLVPFLIGFRYWKRFKKGEKALIVLLGYDVIGIIIGAFLAIYYRNNIVMFNIYAVVEVSLLSFFYMNYIENKNARMILSWFPIIYGVFYLIISIFFIGIHNDNPAGGAVQALFSIVFGAMALGQIVANYEDLNHQGQFWIIIGLLGFYLLNAGYYTMSYWLIETDSSLTWGLYSIYRYSFYALNIFITIGLWLIAKERKTTSNKIIG